MYIVQIQVLIYGNTFAIRLLPKGTANRGKNTIDWAGVLSDDENAEKAGQDRRARSDKYEMWSGR